MPHADCFDLLIEGPDIHCPKCKTPMVAWNWGEQILYTCNGCNALGFNIKRSGIDIERFGIKEIIRGAECKGCSNSVEKRESPPGVNLYTCPECSIGIFVDVNDLPGINIDAGNPAGCVNHKEMKARIGRLYDHMILKLK